MFHTYFSVINECPKFRKMPNSGNKIRKDQLPKSRWSTQGDLLHDTRIALQKRVAESCNARGKISLVSCCVFSYIWHSKPLTQHTFATIIIGSEEMTAMENVMLTIRTLDSRRHDILMHVEDFRPQRHHHDEQQNYCTKGLSTSKLHSLGLFRGQR